MSKTINYNLDTPVGSEVVSIMTGINPNFEKIDEVMKANEDRSTSALNSASVNSQNITVLTGEVTNTKALVEEHTSDITSLKEHDKILEDDISGIKPEILNLIYPVGAFIQNSSASYNPNGILPGSWTRVEGVFILNSSNSYPLGSTGGEASHTLTVDEIPAHEHIQRLQNPNGSDINIHVVNGTTGGFNGFALQTGFPGINENSLNTLAAGGGQTHNNMPPYRVMNGWERVS